MLEKGKSLSRIEYFGFKIERINMDKSKVKDFLEGFSNSDDRKIISIILDNTIHIDHEYMMRLLNKALDEFEMRIPKYNLYIRDDKIGSEHYLLSKVFHRLHPYKCFYKTLPDNNYPILLIDDGIYSSHNMCAIIDDVIGKGLTDNKFYCVVAITSSMTCSVTEMFNAEIIAGMNLEALTIKNLIPNYSYEKMYELFGCETEYVMPIIFDHKIANEFGSYQWYHDVIKKPVDRSVIDSITEDDIQKIVNNLS